tara:strand:- start:1395 stop:1565 length:171 start_codon:yes stop_codon:yes gene_type:complete
MKYQVTFTAMWNNEIEADSREEAEEILERDWDKLTNIDSSFMTIEPDLEEEGYEND